jgi:hypothetical protein
MSQPPVNPSPQPRPGGSEGRPTGLILVAVGCVVALIAGVVFMAVRLTAEPEVSGDPDRAASANQTDRGMGDDQGSEKIEPAALPDPCEVVPARAVAAIVPNVAPLLIPHDNKEGDPSQCVWIGLVASDPLSKRYVEVELFDSELGIADWKKENDNPQDVSGLGEHAYTFAWSTDAAYGVYEPEGGVSVYFAYGDLIARVAVGGWDRRAGEVRAADSRSVLPSAIDLAKKIGKGPGPSGPFARPYLEPDAFVDKELGKGGCEKVPADLAVRFMAKKPEELKAISGEACRLASDFDRAGPNREASRTLDIDFEEFHSSGDAAAGLRDDILIETKKFLDITVVRELPDLGDEAYLLAGRSASAFGQATPDQARAQVLVRRGQRVLRVDFAGRDFPPGVDSFLENPTYVAIPAKDASRAAMELTKAYLADD